MKQCIRRFLFSCFTACIYYATGLATERLIQEVQVEKNKITVIPNEAFKKQFLNNNFFAEYTPDINLEKLDYSIVTIPFITRVAPIVWVSGQTYTIDTMDSDLYHSLETLHKIFKAFFPLAAWSGKLVPKKLVTNTLQKNPAIDAAVLFSGGLDAVYSSLTNLDKRQLLITYRGGDVSLHNQIMWDGVLDHCKEFAQTYRQEHTYATSNSMNLGRLSSTIKFYPTITNWWGQTSQSLTYIGLAAPILYAKGIPLILIGASYSTDCPYPCGTHPLIDNYISFAGISTHHDGALSRIDKVSGIKNICEKNNLPKPFLRVCWGKDPNGGNCLSCEKCTRTIAELLVIQENPQAYGFPIKMEQACKKVQTSLPNRHLSIGTTWHWNCVKQQAKKLKEAVIENRFLKKLVTWLSSFNLSSLSMPHRKPYIDDKAYLTYLWKKAENKTFSLDDLTPNRKLLTQEDPE